MQTLYTGNQQILQLAQQGLSPTQYAVELTKLISTGEITESQFKEFNRAYSAQYLANKMEGAKSSAINSTAVDLPSTTSQDKNYHRSTELVSILLLAVLIFLALYYFWPRFHSFVNESAHELRQQVE